MSNLHFLRGLLFLLLTTTMVSCGDLFMKKSESSSIGNQFLTCELDAKALSQIFTRNIKGDLVCLKENLELFVDVVKTDRPGNLSLKELKLYIEANVKDIDSSVLEALGGIFEINALMFGDHPEYIAKKNVGKLVNLFIDINKSVVDNKVYDYYTTDEKIGYREHNRRKALVFESLSYIGDKINEISLENDQAIDFLGLLQKFKNLDNNTILSNCESLLFVKKMFLGGSEKILTSQELRRLSSMLPDISKVVFDMVHLSDVEQLDENVEEIIQTFRVNVEILVKNLFYSGQDGTVVMSLKNIYDMIDIFLPEYAKWKAYTPYWLKIKNAILEDDKETFTSNEIRILLKDILLNNLNRGAFIFRAYEMNKDILSSPDKITDDLPNMINLGESEEVYKKEMNNIVQNYRFFKGDVFSAKFENNITRNALGIFEVSVYEDIVKRVLSPYGTASSKARGGYYITMEQLVALFNEYKDLLIKEQILDKGRFSDTAETITLLAGLFQSQSDGDGNLEVNELVEFAVELFSGSGLAKVANNYFKEKCDLDSKGKYLPECYRPLFRESLELEKDGIKLKEQLPKLTNYLDTLNPNAVEEYLELTEGFSRTCTKFENGEVVRMNQTDVGLIFSGMLAVEQTMVRFDVNNDNILQPNEVEESFKIYKSAVEALIPVGFLKPLSKSFYLYLMKYKKLPDVQGIKSLKDVFRAAKEGVHFAGFLLKSKRKKQSEADRFTIATILKVISEMSLAEKQKELADNPPKPGEFRFTCEVLR